MVFGVGWTIRECNDDVRLGITKLSSSRLIGRDSPERGREVNDGAMVIAVSPLEREEAYRKVVCSSSEGLAFRACKQKPVQAAWKAPKDIRSKVGSFTAA